MEIPLKAYSNLAEPTVSMSKLLVLKSGDVLPVNVEDTVDFYVEDQNIFTEMGQVKGNIAVNLKERLNILGEKMNAETTENVNAETKNENAQVSEDPKKTDQQGQEVDSKIKDSSAANNLRVLENIDVKLTVEVGNTEIKIRDLLRLNEGSVVELDRLVGEPLDILANGTMIAKGEVVMVGERFELGVLTEVVDPEERVQNL